MFPITHTHIVLQPGNPFTYSVGKYFLNRSFCLILHKDMKIIEILPKLISSKLSQVFSSALSIVTAPEDTEHRATPSYCTVQSLCVLC